MVQSEVADVVLSLNSRVCNWHEDVVAAEVPPYMFPLPQVADVQATELTSLPTCRTRESEDADPATDPMKRRDPSALQLSPC